MKLPVLPLAASALALAGCADYDSYYPYADGRTHYRGGAYYSPYYRSYDRGMYRGGYDRPYYYRDGRPYSRMSPYYGHGYWGPYAGPR
jgi:hypothetical protein